MPAMGGYISYAYRPTFSVKDANVLPNKVQSHSMQNSFMFIGPCIVNIFLYIYIANKMQIYTYYIWKLLYMLQAVPPAIIRSA
jgi:hypothetical protein